MNRNFSFGNHIVVIGDVHGKVNEYLDIIDDCGNTYSSIQVGDFGFRKQHEWHLANIDSAKHKINFGNHDDYNYLYHSHSLSDWGCDMESKIMTVRGADSIDKNYRSVGVDWWEEEQLSYDEMQRAIDFYCELKPKIMITHDCPTKVREELFRIIDKTITSNGLQVMFENHQPALWIFGHHHKKRNQTINGTQFICLNELETIII